jgi:hypothetical protein
VKARGRDVEVTTIEALARTGSVSLSNPELARWVEARVNDRTPTAVVRFGDAEAQLLTAERDDPRSMERAIRKLEKETGLTFCPEAVLEVKALVALAYDGADVIGIQPNENFSDEGKFWIDRLASLYAERVAAGRRPAALASQLLAGQILDMLPQLVTGRRVSVISCRNVKPVLESHWGLEDVAVYQVPSQHMVRDVDGDYEAALHHVPIWPDAHARIRADLTVRERGEVFLVGAGLFGKDLCIRIRDQGGIALDLGSTLDRIAGKVTRGPQRRALDLYASGMSVADIASDFEHVYGVQVDPGRILEVIDAALDDIADWGAAPLESRYSTVHFDALEVQVGDDGSVKGRTCYLALGASSAGDLTPLGIWWPDIEGAEVWLRVLRELRRRGVEDVQTVCIDAPSGFSEAIGAVFPNAEVQGSATVLHRQIRKAIQRRGHFADEQDATKLIRLVAGRAVRGGR